jgi:hypothetical protein
LKFLFQTITYLSFSKDFEKIDAGALHNRSMIAIGG